MMEKAFMRSLYSFQFFMASSHVPAYINRYCEKLDESSWKHFYGQMEEPVRFTKDVNSLFYVLKWILKYDFDDLSYAVFVQDFMDPEGNGGIIKDNWWPILHDRYWQRIKNDIPGLFCNEDPVETALHGPGRYGEGGGIRV